MLLALHDRVDDESKTTVQIRTRREDLLSDPVIKAALLLLDSTWHCIAFESMHM